jgi:hypothetical protein
MRFAQPRTFLAGCEGAPLSANGEFGGIVRLVRSMMNVEARIVLHWTSNSPTQEARAWVTLPKDMPAYGTQAFKNMKLDMFILKSFAHRSSCHEFLVVVAHEFSHIALESIKHPLRTEEKAVDLTAMTLVFTVRDGALRRRGSTPLVAPFVARFAPLMIGYVEFIKSFHGWSKSAVGWPLVSVVEEEVIKCPSPVRQSASARKKPPLDGDFAATCAQNRTYNRGMLGDPRKSFHG